MIDNELLGLVVAQQGRKYLTRGGKVVGPLRLGGEGMEDHYLSGGHAWHSSGEGCGDPDYDLVQEVSE